MFLVLYDEKKCIWSINELEAIFGRNQILSWFPAPVLMWRQFLKKMIQQKERHIDQ